ncbi:MAG: hypothetical protein ABW191_05710 [Aliihoeflea sp.]|jgi:hypothetical protein
MTKDKLYIVIGGLALLALVLGLYVYREETKPSGVEIQINESGISVEEN